ncbi:MAG: TRAG family protein [Defluviitaleaceae bacterium]|nr:TRAG family protein [Defluviitaleaceae bacterium]MCL2275183.1 TRAG family protein [Defluviitaleaceae bacterium]
MKLKPRLVMCTAIFLLGSFISIFFSTALHNVLSRQMTTLAFTGFMESIGSMAADHQHLTLFLCMVGFSFILSIAFFLTNTRPYQSYLHTITPDIQTPAAVGQYQHGSAKWLTDKEKDKTFDNFILDPKDPQIKILLDGGYDGLEFMNT